MRMIKMKLRNHPEPRSRKKGEKDKGKRMIPFGREGGMAR